MISTILTLLTLTSAISSTPLKRSTTLTAASIQQISPQTTTCDNAPAPGECRTASQAAPYIAISFTNFGIASFGEQAALLALMLYESGAFKYAINHYPGVPGQGTRNMQSPAYNLQYAQWLATACTNCGITAATVAQAQADGPAAVLALVNSDEWGFGSAAWFLATQCSADVRAGLAGGSQAGWEAYLQDCVGTQANEGRDALWSAAVALKAW